MEGLSTRAHAFSVEALVSCKKLQCISENDSDTTGPVIENDERNDRTSRICERAINEITVKRKAARGVRVDLQGSDLWKRFYDIGTEMIITKAGRRMFPFMRVKVRNLDPFQQYYIAMDIMPLDSKRYRYVYHSSQWMVAGNTDHSLISPCLYIHPDSPCSGEKWMRQVICFDHVKLTNNETDDKGYIVLQSMHKYKPRIHLILHSPRVDLSQRHPLLPVDGVHTFSFPETQFTTVTAYQNQQITKLKIERNPFAKGFRDSGRNRAMLDGVVSLYPCEGRVSESSSSFCITSLLKTLLPNSCSTAPHPIPFSAPQYCMTFPSSNVVTYSPLMSTLQVKPGYSCKNHCLQNSTTTGLTLFPVPKIQTSCDYGDHPGQNNNISSAFISPNLYSYGLPMSHHFSTTHQLHLGDGKSAPNAYEWH
ncbi:T-box transcription factor TBX22 [Paramisgurnus dabryanus]|uniref:T-box transcription factor TBX22 n=1 Tax=Paramisgurnus dabryanus TaxID=90735 RepID=UPI0031F39007